MAQLSSTHETCCAPLYLLLIFMSGMLASFAIDPAIATELMHDCHILLRDYSLLRISL